MLTDEQVFEVTEFFNGEAWGLLFAKIQSACIHEWLESTDPERREELWRQMQAVMTLNATLHDAPGIKELDRRAHQRRYQS